MNIYLLSYFWNKSNIYNILQNIPFQQRNCAVHKLKFVWKDILQPCFDRSTTNTGPYRNIQYVDVYKAWEQTWPVMAETAHTFPAQLWIYYPSLLALNRLSQHVCMHPWQIWDTSFLHLHVNLPQETQQHFHKKRSASAKNSTAFNISQHNFFFNEQFSCTSNKFLLN